jgi:serine/threonine-protein kinase SRPK3
MTNVDLQIWDIFEGRHLFYGTDPGHSTHCSCAHLAEIFALLGPLPPGFVACGSLRSKLFPEQGQSLSPTSLPDMIGPDMYCSSGGF